LLAYTQPKCSWSTFQSIIVIGERMWIGSEPRVLSDAADGDLYSSLSRLHMFGCRTGKAAETSATGETIDPTGAAVVDTPYWHRKN
jgi:hypothetical protein